MAYMVAELDAGRRPTTRRRRKRPQTSQAQETMGRYVRGNIHRAWSRRMAIYSTRQRRMESTRRRLLRRQMMFSNCGAQNCGRVGASRPLLRFTQPPTLLRTGHAVASPGRACRLGMSSVLHIKKKKREIYIYIYIYIYTWVNSINIYIYICIYVYISK